MAYGKHISQVDRKERKLYPRRTPATRKPITPHWTDREAALYKDLFGVTPLEAQALRMAGITLEQAKACQVQDNCIDAADDAAMYNDLRNGG